MLKLSGGGLKSSLRPAFNREEVDYLIGYMDTWAQGGRLSVEREMCLLLRDYVEMLFLTGMRHVTEALGIDWRNIESGIQTRVFAICIYGLAERLAGVG